MSFETLWHYAAGESFFLILKDGLLMPRSNPAISGRPILWLSSEPFWERSVGNPTGRHCGTSKSLQRWVEQSNGLWRFGIDAGEHNETLTWDELLCRGLLSKEALYAIETKARKRDANPNKWHVRFDPLPLWRCSTIQTLNPDTLEWEALSLNLFPYRLNAA